MERKNITILVTIIVLVFLVTTVFSFYLFSNKDTHAINVSDYNSNGKSEKVLGTNERGTVTLTGPYGNINSPVKIAIIVGVHPLESKSHKAMIESINEAKSLNYCYYIYEINVIKDPSNYDKGRMNGQLLANEFVVPNINNQNYNLVVDIHSNEGNYKEKWFIFAPMEDKNSKSYALKIVNNISGLVYYNPPSQTSPKYVTIPIINTGKPALVYETYLYDSYGVTKAHEEKLLNSIENLKFN